MRLPDRTKFNKIESAYFWAIRYWYKYANDKETQHPMIFNSVMDVFGCYLMEDYLCHADRNDVRRSSFHFTMESFIRVFGLLSPDRQLSVLTDLLERDANPFSFQKKIFKDDNKISDYHEYMCNVIDSLLRLPALFQMREQTDNGKWYDLYDFEMNLEEFSVIVEKNIPNFVKFGLRLK